MSRPASAFKVLSTFAGFFALNSSNAFASDTVDQLQEQLDYLYTIPYHSPMGQSFVPTLPGLDFVELMMSDNTTAPTDGTALVRIRDGWTNGTILGTSETLMLPDCFNFPEGPGCGSAGGYAEIVRFDFDQTVSLIPGHTYALEVVAVTSVFGVGCDSHNPYAMGTMITNGTTKYGFDFWFREGMIPEPSTCAGAMLALTVLARWRRRGFN